MLSMTGYGHSVYKTEDYIMELEIKSYNNRYLDLSYSINPYLSSFENYLGERISTVAHRGHLDVSLRLKVIKNQADVLLDSALFDSYSSAFDQISKRTGLKPQFSDYVNLDGLLAVDRAIDQSIYKEGVERVVNEALKGLKESKERDGEGTHADLLRLGEGFRGSLERIEGNASRLEENFKTILETKFNELLIDYKDCSDRIVQEVGVLLVKYSINEEISRLKTHLKEYFRLLELREPVGKKLDFLSQEMNRECNTIASKSQLADINLLVVDMKDNLENIREQIRNIE